MKRKIEKNFSFNESEELVIYTYLCGEKISRRKWKKIKDKTVCESYKNWSANIQEKYNAYSIDALTEFNKYLNYMIRKKTNTLSIIEIIFYPSIVSGLVSALFAQVAEIEIEGHFIFVFIVALIFGILMGASLLNFIKYIIDSVTSKKIKISMYKDYKKEIKKLIKSKKNSHQE